MRFFGAVAVGAICGFKFMPGALICIVCGTPIWQQLLITIIGGITGVAVFTFFGSTIGRFWRRYVLRKMREESPRERTGRYARIWKKYGIWGAAFLTPPLLSPPLGTALALSFGAPPRKIMFVFSVGMVFWAVLMAAFSGAALLLARHVGFEMPDCGQFL